MPQIIYGFISGSTRRFLTGDEKDLRRPIGDHFVHSYTAEGLLPGNPPMPFETDERLKSYLDTNQLQRERLCVALLALDRRFSDVRPRHPRGGPDGGRDIEALFSGVIKCFGAVGFINQANDASEQKRTARSKYQKDLASALDVDSKPGAFIFFTNINFSTSEKDAMLQMAHKAGVNHAEIFDRERLRILLDAADGLSLRFQYLGLPLSEAEQAAFFARWGDEIQTVISTGFGSLQKALARMHFFQEASFPLTHLTVSLELDRIYQPEEVGHFRAFAHLQLKTPVKGLLNIIFGATDNSSRQKAKGEADIDPVSAGIGNSVCGRQWEQIFPPEFWETDVDMTNRTENDNVDINVRHPYRRGASFTAVGYRSVASVRLPYNKDSFIRYREGPRLIDLDECMFVVLLNKQLAERVQKVIVVGNEYVLQEFTKGTFYVSDHVENPHIDYTFTEAELQDGWAVLRPESASAFRLRFSEETPQRFYAAVDVSGSRGLLSPPSGP